MDYLVNRGYELNFLKTQIRRASDISRNAALKPKPRQQAPVVQRLDNAIHRINRYPADKCWQNKPLYPLDSNLSGG